MRHSLTRRIIALAAAYAVALHALLPVLALAEADAGTLAVICATERPDRSPLSGPQNPEPSGVCGVACASACAAAGLEPQRQARALPLADATPANVALRGDRDPRPARLAHTFQARAPPA